MQEKERMNENIEVVLVQTKDSRNIGSVARAMKNLGFSKLHIVACEDFNRRNANIMACWADDVLDGIQQHSSLEDCLKPFHNVVGFSARGGKNRKQPLDLLSWAVTERDNTSGKLALVFGSEEHGLTNEQASLCRHLVYIPANLEYTSFNLSQAVLLVLFELSRGGHIVESTSDLQSKPTWNEFHQLERIVGEIAESSGFYREGTPAQAPTLIKNLIYRLQPDSREMGLLLAFFSRLERSLDKHLDLNTQV